jgi:hypothetical protein
MLSNSTDYYSYSVDLLTLQQQGDFDRIIDEIEGSSHGITYLTAIKIGNIDDRLVLLALAIRCVQQREEPHFRQAGRHAANRLYSLFNC